MSHGENLVSWSLLILRGTNKYILTEHIPKPSNEEEEENEDWIRQLPVSTYHYNAKGHSSMQSFPFQQICVVYSLYFNLNFTKCIKIDSVCFAHFTCKPPHGLIQVLISLSTFPFIASPFLITPFSFVSP